MKYLRARRRCRHARVACRDARAELHGAVDDVVAGYQAHPLPVLAVAAVAGFVLAKLRAGSSMVRGVVGVATGPAWGLVRQYLQF